MRELIKSKFKFVTKIIRDEKIRKRAKYEYSIFKRHWLYSKPTIKKVGYEIILDEHSLEKGMTSAKPRHFGISKVKNIIRCLKLYDNNGWEHDYAYNLGVSILHEYKNFYKEHGWENEKEYLLVANFINDKKSPLKTGVTKIKKEDFISQATIDYDAFLSSRHSIREFQNRKIPSHDFRKIVNMVSKTPTACNRQMCKIYYIKTDSVKNKILKFSHGLTGFNNKTVNPIVVTYDISSLCVPGEITQGMFNAGLVSMNLVNAMHASGIGSCFLEYSNDKKEEDEMKKIIGIPSNEKIAVVIAAGYYPEKSIIPRSTRKPLDDIYVEI